jgi:hypothetical protein
MQTKAFWSVHELPQIFSLQIATKLLCSCLCSFDTIVEFHAMDEEMFNDFLIGE